MCGNHLLLFNHATATCSTGPADDETFFPYTLWWKPIQFWNTVTLYLRKQCPLRKEAMAQSIWPRGTFVTCSLLDDYIVMLMFLNIQNITRCNPVKVNRCFGGTHRLHVSGLTSNPTDGKTLHIKLSTVSESNLRCDLGAIFVKLRTEQVGYGSYILAITSRKQMPHIINIHLFTWILHAMVQLSYPSWCHVQFQNFVQTGRAFCPPQGFVLLQNRLRRTILA
jgi:hypothetical protein